MRGAGSRTAYRSSSSEPSWITATVSGLSWRIWSGHADATTLTDCFGSSALPPTPPQILGTKRVIEKGMSAATSPTSLAYTGRPKRRVRNRSGMAIPQPSHAKSSTLLMSASIRSLGTKLSLPLLTALLEHGVWSPIKTLAYARNLSSPKDRSLVLSALSERFPEQKAAILRESREVARTCDSMDCAEAIAALSTHLPDGQKKEVLSEALSQWFIVQHKHFSEAERARILSLLAPQLPPKLLRGAFEVTRGLEDLEVKGKTLAALAPSLPDEWRS